MHARQFKIFTFLVFAIFVMPAVAEAKITYGHLAYANSTSYCDSGLMADGSYVRSQSIAMNNLPLGTEIKLAGKHLFGGHKNFRVRDRIGWGSQLDFWTGNCGYMNWWGRRTVSYRVVHR
jgi:hypothetical protein